MMRHIPELTTFPDLSCTLFFVYSVRGSGINFGQQKCSPETMKIISWELRVCMLTLNYEFVKVLRDCFDFRHETDHIHVSRYISPYGYQPLTCSRQRKGEPVMFTNRLYHFHRNRVFRTNVNDCPAVNKEKPLPKTVKKKRKLLKSQYFSVEVC